jgi:hypothetical protein
LAVRAAVNAPLGASGLVGWFSLPSESNTIRAGGGVSLPPITAPTVAMACSAVKMLSPIAVRSINCSLSIAALVASRLVVGDTKTIALPPNSISPKLIPGVSSSANCLAASSAAASRLGDTSVARMDGETSITNITTARFRGMRTSRVGPASPTVSSSSEHTSRIAARCRQRLGRLRDTLSSSSMFANRNIRL